jgi:pimeloyl-ACP methyl ester carboxylesterase
MKRRFAVALSTALFALSARGAHAAPLAALPHAQRSFTSGALHADVYGSAGKPAMILVPGLACGPWEFGNEIAAFAPSYRIYAITLPGFDNQPAIRTPLFTTVSADFWKLLETEHIDKPVIVGHSLGATLAEMLATQHADRLRAVVAIDGLPVFPGTESLSQEQRTANAGRAAAQTAGTPKAAYGAVLKTYVMPYMVTAKEDAERDAALEAASDPAAAAAWLGEDLSLDLRPDLAKAATPLLLIAPYDASLDTTLKSADAKRAYYASLVAKAPHAKTIVIEASRHFIMNDQPRALDEAIAGFLTGD